MSRTPWDDLWIYDYEDNNSPTVCTRHKRFIPCRLRSGCRYSDAPEDVEVVREYQQGEIRKYNEERQDREQ